MHYKLFGNTGLRVSELCLGTMTFGGEGGWGVDEVESRRVFDQFVEHGGNFFDTANHYTKGRSERLLGEFVGADRDQFVIATKYTLCPRPQDPNAGGNHRKNLMQSVEASLKRLNTDYIDLYWVHAWDFMTPIDEVLRGLDDLVSSGKVHYIGISDTPAWIVSSANTLAELRGWSAFAGLQIQYSLVERTPERDLLPMAQAFGLTLTPWGILGFGTLTGKYSRSKDSNGNTRLSEGDWREIFITERNLSIAREVDRIADELECSSSQVAIAWLLAQDVQIVPIVGARTCAHLEDNLQCLEVELSDSQVDRLNEVSAIESGFPHAFLAQPNIQEAIYGETLQRIIGR